jgi:hypothetical protein
MIMIDYWKKEVMSDQYTDWNVVTGAIAVGFVFMLCITFINDWAYTNKKKILFSQ